MITDKILSVTVQISKEMTSSFLLSFHRFPNINNILLVVIEFDIWLFAVHVRLGGVIIIR